VGHNQTDQETHYENSLRRREITRKNIKRNNGWRLLKSGEEHRYSDLRTPMDNKSDESK
jgi:hypothetical protein